MNTGGILMSLLETTDADEAAAGLARPDQALGARIRSATDSRLKREELTRTAIVVVARAERARARARRWIGVKTIVTTPTVRPEIANCAVPIVCRCPRMRQARVSRPRQLVVASRHASLSCRRPSGRAWIVRAVTLTGAVAPAAPATVDAVMTTPKTTTARRIRREGPVTLPPNRVAPTSSRSAGTPRRHLR
jgi:hypothetical protein